jgi:hypothetical protein
MTRRLSRVWLATSIAVWSMLAVDGCDSGRKANDSSTGASSTARSSSASESSEPHALDPHKMSDAEFKFGVSPTRNLNVTYQPDVVLMEHGAEAVKSMSSNGLAWTLDANAPGAADVKEGKIIFATNRVVGRVLGVVRKGSEMQVVLGPVALTEVIKDAHLSYDQPVDLGQMIAYSAPDYPGADGDTTPPLRTAMGPRRARTSVSFAKVTSTGDVLPMLTEGRAGAVRVSTAMLTSADRQQLRAMQTSRVTRGSRTAESRYSQAIPQVPDAPQLPGISQIPGASSLPTLPPMPSTPSIGPPSEVSISDFKVVPFCCGGLGMKIDHKDARVQLTAYAVLRLSAPSLHFKLDIVDGAIKTAVVELRGAAGLTVHFDAYSFKGLDGNINTSFYVPVDLTIPIGGMAVPFAVTVRQTFLVETRFSAKQSKMSAEGDYAFGGSVEMGYSNGGWGVSAPEQLHTKRNLAESISGASMGINGLTFAYGGRVIVGIGAFGFVTGPFLAYNTSVGVTRATDLSAPSGRICGSSRLLVLLKAGVGYQIPQTVTKAINFFLRALNLKEIEGSGGIATEKQIVDKKDVWPKDCPVPQ